MTGKSRLASHAGHERIANGLEQRLGLDAGLEVAQRWAAETDVRYSLVVAILARRLADRRAGSPAT